MTTITPKVAGSSFSEVTNGSKRVGSAKADEKPSAHKKIGVLVQKIAENILNPIAPPANGSPTREINITGISSGAQGEFSINLASGGGFATVELTEDGAKFTMNTPAYLRDEPGLVTQNVLEFDINFSDLSPKKHAQLVGELKTALLGADDAKLNKSENALVEQALEFLDTPEVNQELTLQSAISALKELIEGALKDIEPKELKEFKNGFDALVPQPQSEYEPENPQNRPIVEFFSLANGRLAGADQRLGSDTAPDDK